MPFNGSGTFTRLRNWQADAAAGIKIKADFHDCEDDNFAPGVSNVICKDGQSSPTADIPFNGKKITNLANPVDPQDAATKNLCRRRAISHRRIRLPARRRRAISAPARPGRGVRVPPR